MKEQWDQMVKDVSNRFPPDFGHIPFYQVVANEKSGLKPPSEEADYGPIPDKRTTRNGCENVRRVRGEIRKKLMDTYRNHDTKLKSYKKEYISIPEDKDGVKTGRD